MAITAVSILIIMAAYFLLLRAEGESGRDTRHEGGALPRRTHRRLVHSQPRVLHGDI